MMYCKYFIPEDNYHKPICTFNFNEAILQRRIIKCLQIVVKDVSITQLNILL